MSRAKSKFALIWWTECKQIDIIPSSQLPKNNKRIGSVVKLSWQSLNKKFQRYEAKILAFGATVDEMQQIIVNAEGQIYSSEEKTEEEAPLNKRKKIEQDELSKVRTKCQSEVQIIIKNDENLPLLNLNPSTSTATTLRSTESRINSDYGMKNDTKESECSSESSDENDDNAPDEFLKRKPFGKVTLRDVKHIERFAAFMRSQYEFQQRNKSTLNGKR